MKPGDLVQIKYRRGDGERMHDAPALAGKVGLIVKTVPSAWVASPIFEVLVDGRGRIFHQSYLESIDETG